MPMSDFSWFERAPATRRLVPRYRVAVWWYAVVLPAVTAMGCTSGTTDPISGAGVLGGPPVVAPGQAPPMPAKTPERFGDPVMDGSGTSSERYAKADVTRDGKNYFLMANGWGPKFESQTISWEGTSFNVVNLEGRQGDGFQPATYPTVFCGVYSDSASKECGLPAKLDELSSLRTGWSWAPADVKSNQQYNAAYDIWLANGPTRSEFSGFFMVWLRDPPGQQPAGSRRHQAQMVQNVPGVWDIWTGEVNERPIINYVRAEGGDTFELEFDVLDFIHDAEQRGLQVPGTHVLSVAVGFEIWNGPLTNLETVDFYVDAAGSGLSTDAGSTPSSESSEAGTLDAGRVEVGTPEAGPDAGQ